MVARPPASYSFPAIFKRLSSARNPTVQHLARLRESKKYRLEHGHVVVQGVKQIRELVAQGVEVESLLVTAVDAPRLAEEVKYPARTVLEHPEAFPALHRYLINVDLSRRILGTASKPDKHDLLAEIRIPDHALPPPSEKSRVPCMLVCDQISDPGNLGTIVRTAMALGWHHGAITANSCDLYNDKTMRAARAMNLHWKHATVNDNNDNDNDNLPALLRAYDMTPVVADMLPRKEQWHHLWSPIHGDYTRFDAHSSQNWLGSGVWLWNMPKEMPNQLPKRIALILSSEHQGVKGFDNEIRISVPMATHVESMNVASVAAILMSELNRLRST
ncbi:Alpha/beta knot methyltransferase [Gongronella butleri]|nr:Alpha/beta knot methyltransferase [Gongronella butleri]